MAYRDDLEAAQARAEALAREAEELRAKNAALEADARELEQLRATNAELAAKVRQLDPRVPVLAGPSMIERHRQMVKLSMVVAAFGLTLTLIGVAVALPAMIGIGFLVAVLGVSRAAAPP